MNVCQCMYAHFNHPASTLQFGWGYLFLRNFGNFGSCHETSEKFGRFPKFSDSSEEFSGHSLAL